MSTHMCCVSCVVDVNDKTLVSTSVWSRLAAPVFANTVKQCQVNDRDNGGESTSGYRYQDGVHRKG